MAEEKKEVVEETVATETTEGSAEASNEEVKAEETTEATETPAEEAKSETPEEVVEEPKAEEPKEEPKAEEATEEVKAEEPAKEEVKAEETPSEEEKEEPKAEETTEEPAAEKVVAVKKEDSSGKGGTKVKKDQKRTADTDFVFRIEEPTEEFDWDSADKEQEVYSATEREEYDKQYSDTLTSIAEKEVLPGIVVSVGKKEVVINIGYKSEGVVGASEFRYNPDLKPGDEVPVYVEKQEDKSGQLVISHKTARTHSAWQNVNDAMANDTIITGHIKCRTKGGLIVDVFGIEAFLPGSQIDVKPIRDYDQYVGKNMEFKVVKINQEFKNVVVSHKALIEAELEEQKKQIIGKLEKGQVLEGTVKNITSYGVFIDLGGVDGLIHITDLSWGRVNHPEEVVELDQR